MRGEEMVSSLSVRNQFCTLLFDIITELHLRTSLYIAYLE